MQTHMPRRQHQREIEKLDKAYRAALDAGDKEGAKMIAEAMASHAIQQHHGI